MQGMNTNEDYVQMVCDAVQQMVVWTCDDAHPSSATGKQQQRLKHHWNCISQLMLAPRRLRGRAANLAVMALLEICKVTAGLSSAAATAEDSKYTVLSGGVAAASVKQCSEDSSRSYDQQVDEFYRLLEDLSRSANAEFPVPYCCNNPSCVNLSKLSEYQLVSGKACVCGGCKVARYCSRECQEKHWKQHKEVCCLLSR